MSVFSTVTNKLVASPTLVSSETVSWKVTVDVLALRSKLKAALVLSNASSWLAESVSFAVVFAVVVVFVTRSTRRFFSSRPAGVVARRFSETSSLSEFSRLKGKILSVFV